MGKFIDGRQIILRIRDNFLPQNSNWIIDAASWINNAMQGLGCGAVYLVETETYTVENGRLLLPCTFKAIKEIKYGDTRLVCNDKRNDYYYTWNGNQPNYIFFSFNSGDIQLTYYKLAIVDTDDDVNWVLIPDKEEIKEYLEWSVIYHSMLRGMTHQTIKDWREAYAMVNQLKPKAVASLLMLTPEDLEQVVNSSVGVDKVLYNIRDLSSGVSPRNEIGNVYISNVTGDESAITNEYIPL